MSRASTHKPTSAAARRTEARLQRVRMIAIGFVVVLAVGVIIAGIWYSRESTPEKFVAGQHYAVIENARGHTPGTPITVQEFFSYACEHCRAFDPMIEAWRTEQPDDVRFERVPATFSHAWTVLGQSYYALAELGALEANHERLFRAIHDNGRQFLTIEEVAEFVDGNGTTRDAFLQAANGTPVRDRLRAAERAQRTLRVGGVPTLVVGGRYVVTMSEGRQTALDTIDWLIEQDRSGAPVSSQSGEPDAADAAGAQPPEHE
jgi:thiol:disulfide interchange protein DsbA